MSVEIKLQKSFSVWEYLEECCAGTTETKAFSLEMIKYSVWIAAIQ